METKKFKISEAEMELMRIIWSKNEEVTANDLLELLPEENLWKLTTVLTLASRLVKKGILKLEKKGKTNYYSSLMSEEEYKRAQSNVFLEEMYCGSIKNFIATLYGGKKNSKKELEELKKWFLEEI
ncbi:BlaI/MecI/CopY family transcriptional regulator [Clostridium thailandense]|uniref:BlaI/MecI/CopY family transcriptional regulator n=1 Tax=Clostridium thailandense TaxID=2794346 RepID=UPI0039896404